MFDNPKKELERLEQQLLASQTPDTADDFDEYTEEYDFAETGPNDAPEDDRAFSRRSAGFDIRSSAYEMDASRYVPVAEKKGIGKLLITFVKIGLVIALIAWWKGWIL